MSNSIDCQHIPTDLITPGEAIKIAGNPIYLSCARRFNPENFPRNYGGKQQYARYSRAEIVAFFAKYPPLNK